MFLQLIYIVSMRMLLLLLLFIFQRHGGSGVLVSVVDGKYEGSWEDDLRHGAGRQTYLNGDVYEGCWERNKVIRSACAIPGINCQSESSGVYKWFMI